MKHKCKFPNGVANVRFADAVIDPCKYELAEIHKNVTVEVLKCPECGSISIGWKRQDNTEDIIMEETETNEPI